MASASSAGCRPVMATTEVGDAGVLVSKVTIWLVVGEPERRRGIGATGRRQDRERREAQGQEVRDEHAQSEADSST